MVKKKIWANFQRIIELFTHKIVTKPPKIWVWDPGKTYSGSRIQISKRHRIPNPRIRNTGLQQIIARLAQLMRVGTGTMAGFVYYVSVLLQSELATQAGLTAALMGVLELLTPQHHVLLWRADCAVLGTYATRCTDLGSI